MTQLLRKNKDVTNEKRVQKVVYKLEEEIAKEQVSLQNEEIERLDKLTAAKEEKN